MKQYSISILTLFLSLVLNGQNEKRIQNSLDSICEISGYPGIVFSYVKPDGSPYSYASGFADSVENIPLTPKHKMHGGSTGKTVVSSVVLQLVQEGVISLNDKVSTFLGSNKWFTRIANHQVITIRHLLQHTSGIIRYEFKPEFIKELNANPNKIWSPEELLYFVFNDEPPFKAGEGFTYSDTNYILLGMIVEIVTENSFYMEAKSRVLESIDISSFTSTNNNEISNMAQGYFEGGSKYSLGFKAPFLKDGIPQNNIQFEWTGGGYVFENVEYAILIKKIHEGEVYDLEALREEVYNYVEADEIKAEYGLGVVRYKFPKVGVLIGHSGFFPGYNTAGYYHPESKMSFSMQVNTTNFPQLMRFMSDYLKLIEIVLEGKS